MTRFALTIGLLLAAGQARAERLRMLVLVGSEEHREVAARIKGQTADLDAVVATAEGALPATLDEQIAVARAARARADAVVWFGTDGGDWLAYIARDDHVLVRRIEVAPGALSRSASIEAVALAVRTALTGFAAAEGEGAARRRDAVRAWGELGWTGVLDGSGALGNGVALRLGAARGRWRLGAALAYHPPVPIHAAVASIDVGRQQAALLVGADLFPARADPAARWALGLELGLGAARLSRSTTATGSGLVATAATTAWSPVVAPGVRVARRLVSRGWLVLAAGVDLLTRPLEFGVQRGDGFDRVASLWACEPRASLSVLLDWR